MSIDPTIELKVGQTAQPHQCGSCRFFSRVGNDAYGEKIGQCTIRLPPQIQIRSGNIDEDYVGPTNRISDDDRCDFWQSDGKMYIERRRVLP